MARQVDPSTPPARRRGRRPRTTATVDAGAGAPVPSPTPAAPRPAVVDDAPRAARPKISIDVDWSHAATKAIATVDLQIIGRISKARPELLERIAWTDRELALIEPSIGKLLGKYGGTLLENWGDELSLLVLLSTITNAKLAALKHIMAEERRAAAAADPARQPIRFPEHAPGGDAGAAVPS